MQKVTDWVKANKLSVLLIIIILFLFGKSSIKIPLGGVSDSMGLMYKGTAPQSDVVNRKVITKSHLSILVKNVTSSLDKIKSEVTNLKGYVVSENITRNPQTKDESATVVIRIPTASVELFKKDISDMSIKVVSENISGTDITDEYIDIEGRISRLEKTKAIFESILDDATNIDDILRVNREILNLQSQIDSYIGQLKYMEGVSSTSLITLNLSTDELSLPYSPAKAWRPSIIFKTAVRSLLANLQSIGSFIIWGAVYLPLVVLIIVAYKLVRKKQRK